ncbi:MAG: hypothetical protein QOI03_1496 [Solirubrobacteraceae bacterium]|jgi:hypothetical protein|nr:hypothetical protein [Solirubrobacteraceae bacterium]
MSESHPDRAVENEVLSRHVNEAIFDRETSLAGQDVPSVAFLCECARAHCTSSLPLAPHEWERLHASPRWFVVLPGHEDPALERVVEKHSSYVVVEKDLSDGEGGQPSGH